MNPERFQQIENLFHLALERESAERAAFLNAECGADYSLRRAVESLLAHHQQAENFIESPATLIAAGIFDDEKSELEVGRGHRMAVHCYMWTRGRASPISGVNLLKAARPNS